VFFEDTELLAGQFIFKANGSIASWGSLDNSWNEIKNKTTNAPGAFVPPESELPHALIEPSALRAAKAYVFE
jgi:hypothetical protein